MLTSALRALIKNPVKENFYEEKKKINVLTDFFIFHKSDVKTFQKSLPVACWWYFFLVGDMLVHLT